MATTMFLTREAAMAAALNRQREQMCSTGRHSTGCPHRPCSPWVARALGINIDLRLPTKDFTRSNR